MTNAYNLLPSTSPLRPRTLLALLSLLSVDLLPSLSLSVSQIEQYIFEWSISDSDRIQWLNDVAAVYEAGISASAAPSAATTTQLKEKSLELRVLALTVAAVKGLGIEASAVEKTIGAALSVASRFDISGVLSIKGVRESLKGDIKELVALLEGEGEAGGDLKKATVWVESKSQWLESIGKLGVGLVTICLFADVSAKYRRFCQGDHSQASSSRFDLAMCPISVQGHQVRRCRCWFGHSRERSRTMGH